MNLDKRFTGSMEDPNTFGERPGTIGFELHDKSEENTANNNILFISSKNKKTPQKRGFIRIC